MIAVSSRMTNSANKQKGATQCASSWWAPARSADISAAGCSQAGADVTFLVRERRAAELAAAGLVIKSPLGDVTLKNPPTVQADKLSRTIRRRAAELQGLRPRRCDKILCAGGRTQHRDPAAAQRHAASGHAGRKIRPRARARRPLRHRGHAEREARGGPSAAAAVAHLRRARRQILRSRPRHRRV